MPDKCVYYVCIGWQKLDLAKAKSKALMGNVFLDLKFSDI